MRKSTEKLVRVKLRTLINPSIQNQALKDSIEEALIHFLHQMYVEAEPLEFLVMEHLCPWDMGMHRDPECMRKLKEWEKEEREKCH